MRVWFSLIPKQAITMVNHAKFHAVYYQLKNKDKHIFSAVSGMITQKSVELNVWL